MWCRFLEQVHESCSNMLARAVLVIPFQLWLNTTLKQRSYAVPGHGRKSAPHFNETVMTPPLLMRGIRMGGISEQSAIALYYLPARSCLGRFSFF